MGKGRFKGLLQGCFVSGFGDAHRTSRIGWLDKHRIMKPLGNPLLDLVKAVHFIFHHLFPLDTGNTSLFQKGAGHSLIHADCRGQGTAAHTGDAGNLQKALHGAVLSIFPMENGKYHIEADIFHMIGVENCQPMDAPVR